MSYICEFCGLRPESCACAIDLTEPRLETELAVADNMMAVANPVIQRPYGLVDAPSPADFFSLLVEMEREESKYDTPPSTPGCISAFNLPPPPKLERQTNRPLELFLTEDDLQDIQSELFPDCKFSELDIQPCHEVVFNSERTRVCWTPQCENMVANGMCYDCIMAHHQQKEQLVREAEYKRKVQIAKTAYEFAREHGTYEYYRFARDFPEEVEELIKCPTCEEMIYPDDQHGMCYTCFMLEQRLHPDDISMDLRYRDSF
jgi:hypothetical protein